MLLHLVRYVWFHVAADGPDPAGNAWAIAALAALAAARPDGASSGNRTRRATDFRCNRARER